MRVNIEMEAGMSSNNNFIIFEGHNINSRHITTIKHIQKHDQYDKEINYIDIECLNQMPLRIAFKTLDACLDALQKLLSHLNAIII